MKSREELLEMFYSKLWDMQETNNVYVKSSLKHDLALLLCILEGDIEKECVELAETLLSRSYFGEDVFDCDKVGCDCCRYKGTSYCPYEEIVCY